MGYKADNLKLDADWGVSALRQASYMKPRHAGFFNKPKSQESGASVWPWAKINKDVTGMLLLFSFGKGAAPTMKLKPNEIADSGPGNVKGYSAGSWRDRASTGPSNTENEKPRRSVMEIAGAADNADAKKQPAATGSSWW